MSLLPLRSARAAADGVYPKSATAASTRSRVSGEMRWCGVSLMT